MTPQQKLEIEKALLDWLAIPDLVREAASRLDRAMENTLPSFRVPRVFLYRQKQEIAGKFLDVADFIREKLDEGIKETTLRTRDEVLKSREGCGACCDRYADNKACDCLEEAW